jgi:hypothetical protein
VTTAVHLWRFYFRFTNPELGKLSESSRLNWEACDRAAKVFSEPEIDILRRYYMTGYGKYEDMQAIKEFAEANGIKQGDAWDVIKRANYEVVIERGLMDRKEVETNGSA